MLDARSRGRRLPGRRRGVLPFRSLAVVGSAGGIAAIVVLLILPLLGVPTPHPFGFALPHPTAARSDGRLVLGPIEAVTPSTFWGVVLQTSTPTGIRTTPSLAAFLAQTPFRWFSYTLDTDNCNLTANRFYSDSGQVVPTGCPFSIPDFVQWCESVHPTCHSILKLPGENNDSSEDAYYANWIVNGLGFQPDYWTIGNEPMLWNQYGLSWSNWTNTSSSHPTPLAYAIDARNAMAAVRAVDPAARFIGIESDCQCSAKDWMATTAAVNGPTIAAVGYHTYPSTALLTNETLPEFLQPLASPVNITASYATVRNAIAPQCPTCATLPIFVTEYNSGPGRGATQWAGTYADAVFLAASTAQALSDNVTMFLTYNLQGVPGNNSTLGWGLVNYTNQVDPEGLLYSQLFSHFATGTVYVSGVATAIPSVWSVLSENGTNGSLLIVNANLTTTLNLSVGGSLPAAPGRPATVYAWNTSVASPVPTSGPIPAQIAIPPLGMVLVDFAVGSGAAPTFVAGSTTA
jgi:hypothetical protein